MITLPKSFDDWPLILEINFMLTLLFIVLAFLLLVSVLAMRMYKNRKESRRIIIQNAFIDLVNNYMFDEDFDKKTGLQTYKTMYSVSSYDKKISLTQILMLNENLKGESSHVVKELFFGLGLCTFLLEDLKSKGWHKKTRALYSFNKLDVKVPERLVVPLVNARRQEVSHQAMLYLISNSKEDPFAFFNSLDKPLTLWRQVGLETALKSYEGEIPNFSLWLGHKLPSVIIFCIKMIVDHNQFENVVFLQQLVNHDNPQVRRQAIISLTKMEVPDILPNLVINFPQEKLQIKLEILNAIAKLGSEQDLKTLLPYIQSKDSLLKMHYVSIARTLTPEILEVVTGPQTDTVPILQSS